MLQRGIEFRENRHKLSGLILQSQPAVGDSPTKISRIASSGAMAGGMNPSNAGTLKAARR
jgi:hypothetical protein